MRGAESRRSRSWRELLTTGAIAFNALLGLAAQVALANRVGPGRELDAFFAASALPLALVGISASAFSAVIIPAIRYREARGEDVATFETALARFFVLVSFGLSLTGWLATRIVLGGAAGSSGGDTGDLVARLLPLFWVMCGLGLVSQALMALHHQRQWFVLSTLSSSLLSGSLIAGAVFLYRPYGVGALALAYVVGGLLQAVVLVAPLRSVTRSRWRLPSREVMITFTAALPVVLTVLPNTFGTVSDAFWATGLPTGSLSYLGFTSRLTIACAAIITTGIAIVAFPDLATLAARGAVDQLRLDLAALTLRAALVLMPIASILYAIRNPLISMLFERGAFSAADRLAVAGVLPYFLVGMVFMGCSNLLVRAFYALNASVPAAAIGVLTLLVYFVLSGALAHHFGFTGIAAAYAITWMGAFGAQVYGLARRIGTVFQWSHVARIALGGFFSLVAGQVAARVMDLQSLSASAQGVEALWSVGSAAAVGGVIYGALLLSPQISRYLRVARP